MKEYEKELEWGHKNEPLNAHTAGVERLET